MRVAVVAGLLAGCYFDGPPPPRPPRHHAHAEHLWSHVFGNGFDTLARDLAVDGAGNTVVVGRSDIPLGTPAPSHDVRDAFVVALSPDGAMRWSRALGGSNYDQAYAVAVAPSGEIVIGGELEGEADFGTGMIGGGEHSPFLAGLTASGKTRWARTMSGKGEVRGVAMRGGDTVVAGRDLVDGACTTGEAMAARVLPAGGIGWTTCLDSHGYGYAERAAVDPHGDVFVCGVYRLRLVIDGTVYISDAADFFYVAAARDHVFLAKLDGRDGHVQWVKSARGDHASDCLALAASPTGEIAVAGEYNGTIVLDGRTLPASPAGHGGFVAMFAPDGSGVRAFAIAGSGRDGVGGLVFDDELVVAGKVDGNAFVAGHGAHGERRWTRPFRGGEPVGLARGPRGSLVVLGRMFTMSDGPQAIVDLGGGELHATPGGKSSWFDFFVARVAY